MTLNTSEQIKNLLAEDKIKEALDLLPKFLEKNIDLDTVIVQSAIYKRLMTSVNRQTIDWEKAGIIKNQIIVSILDIVNLSNETSNIHEKHSTIFSEMDSLKEAISKIPNKSNSLLRFLTIQTSLIFLIALIAIAFGTGLIAGDLRLLSDDNTSIFSNESPVNKQEIKQPIINDSTLLTDIDNYKKINDSLNQELSSSKRTISQYKRRNEELERNNLKPKVSITEGARYSNSIGDYIHFYSQNGKNFEFSGEVGAYSIAGNASLNGNKITLRGQTVEGTLTLLENGRMLIGQVNVSSTRGGSKHARDVDLRRN